MLVGIASNEISIVSSRNIKAKIKGNNTVQQKLINWSYLILGKLALVHINVNTKAQVLTPKEIPDKPPSNKGLFNCITYQSKGYK
jgi:ubiquitin-protein ligase